MLRLMTAAVFMCLLALPVNAPAAAPEAPGAGAACSLDAAPEGPTSAVLPRTARVGEKVVLTASQPPLPAGGFGQARVTWLSRPEGREPDVLPGWPETDLVFHVPGRYRLAVQVGCLVRSS